VFFSCAAQGSTASIVVNLDSGGKFMELLSKKREGMLKRHRHYDYMFHLSLFVI
jgi:hypothetical protein